MSEPKRIQLSRRKGWRMPEGAVKVDRTTKWGNPFKIDNARMHNGDWQVFRCTDGRLAGPPVGHYPTKAEAVAASVRHYRHRMTGDTGNLLRRQALIELGGKDLACWCRLDAFCHADVLLELANPKPPSPRGG